MNGMTKKLLEIINRWRLAGVRILDEEAESVRKLCVRKMLFVKTDDPEGYMELLYEDEVKWKLVFGKSLNTASVRKENAECAMSA